MIGCLNQSTQDEFNILAFSTSPVGQFSIFLGVSLMYLMTLLGNVTIIFLVFAVPKLHTPMYFFLCNLSFEDVISTSSYIPKFLMITLTQNHSISFHGCIIQLSFFVLCALSENFILMSMAYDRYLAICKPLRYYIIMSKTLRVSLSAFSWLTGAFTSLLNSLLASMLLFCNSHDINNFFCDLNSMISLSSSYAKNITLLLFFEVIVMAVVPFLLIITSYVFIISNVLKIHARGGRRKAFSSCVSHLITVLLFYGPCIFLYMREESKHLKEQNKLLSMLYLVVVPMLNPLVYSLRNKDIRETLATVMNYNKKMY